MTNIYFPLRFPDWHVQSISARKGCVIIEVNMVELRGSDEGSLAGAVSSEPAHQDLIAILQSQGMLDPDAAKGSLVCINVSI